MAELSIVYVGRLEAEVRQLRDALREIADGCCVCDGEDRCDRCIARAALEGVDADPT